MPRADVNGIGIHYDDHGQGYPLIWSHEFAGDHRSWETQ
ncbi:MAG TPA: alpha/beta hydrolase, partial [Dehalococcoidia bacterium]|nr:alpha/beta hydrolase [Dehalococcoidia bacterium]